MNFNQVIGFLAILQLVFICCSGYVDTAKRRKPTANYDEARKNNRMESAEMEMELAMQDILERRLHDVQKDSKAKRYSYSVAS